LVFSAHFLVREALKQHCHDTVTMQVCLADLGFSDAAHRKLQPQDSQLPQQATAATHTVA